MQGAGIEPGPDTYTALLSAYAEMGDLDALKKVCVFIQLVVKTLHFYTRVCLCLMNGCLINSSLFVRLWRQRRLQTAV